LGRRGLLPCGVIAPLMYVAMTLLVGLLWEGYSNASQTVSELSAIDAPTRPLWIPLGMAYSALTLGFGWAVRISAGTNRPLRIVGALIIAQAVVAVTWPPMHQRAVLAAGGKTLTDSLHIAWTVATVLILLTAIGFGAAAFGRRFRLYSIATIVLLAVFGALAGMDAPRLEADLPTPWIGVWERLNIIASMAWLMVLAVLMRARSRRERLPGARRGSSSNRRG
jgi:hypothetical protein